MQYEDSVKARAVGVIWVVALAAVGCSSARLDEADVDGAAVGRADASTPDASIVTDAAAAHLTDAAPTPDAAHAGASDAAVAVERDAAVGCSGGAALCGARCVDLELDPAHCGRCSVACATGELCSRGKCGVSCFGGTTRCGARCVDSDVDPANCGTCGASCGATEICSAGACIARCGANATLCGTQCIELGIDPKHCGSCDNACFSDQVCRGGVCQSPCGVGSVACNGSCVILSSDHANCGACGNACANTQACNSGQCSPVCDSGSGLSACYGSCVDLQSDASHCGTCATSCSSGLVCDKGNCVCALGQSLCSGVCTDTQTDAANCSVCGVACRFNEACALGTCDCRTGTLRCGNNCVDVGTSAANCGACGTPCPAGKVCTRGTCAVPSSDWPTFQHDIQHTGENANETGKPPLTFAWSRTLLGTPSINPVAIDHGRVFLTTSVYFSSSAPLYVLNVSDGSDLWSHDFGAISSMGHPSVFSGAVYLGNGQGTSSPPAYFWSLDAASGQTNWAALMSAQWETYWAPIRVGNTLFTNGGSFGGMYGFAAADGSQLFFVSTLDQYDQWSPAYFGGHVFTYMNNNFRKHDVSTGAVLSTVNTTSSWSGYSVRTAPVFGSTYGYLVVPPNLFAIDPALDKLAWTANGNYESTPALSANALYGVSAKNLVVRDATTGNYLWSFVGDGALSYPPVIANGYVYVASPNHVYAIDISTHQAVWTANIGGWLAIAEHRLLVAASTGTLTAYLLSP